MTQPLTAADIDQIVEGIEEFIIGDNDDLIEIWQPYIDKLHVLQAAMVAKIEGNADATVL